MSGKTKMIAELVNQDAELAALRARVVELEALVEAATSFVVDGPGGWYHVGKVYDYWSVYTLGNRLVSERLTRDQAFARARALAGGKGGGE